MDLIIEGAKTGRFAATTDFDRMAEPDALLIAVPTPLTKYREPDLSYVVKTTEAIAKRLRKDQLIVLESTTYPGTTDEVMRPILEKRERAEERRGVLPGLLAGARGSRQPRFRHFDDSEGGRRRRR